MEINLHQAVAMVREIPEEEEGETAMVLLQLALVLPPMAQKSKAESEVPTIDPSVDPDGFDGAPLQQDPRTST